MFNRREMLKRSASTFAILVLPTNVLAEKIVDEKVNWLLKMENLLLTSFANKINQESLNKNSVEFADVYFDENLYRMRRHGWYGVIGYSNGMEIGQSVDAKIKSLPDDINVFEVADKWTAKLKRIAIGDFIDLPDFFESISRRPRKSLIIESPNLNTERG